MGHHCTTDIVPFVAHDILAKSSFSVNVPPDHFAPFLSFEEWIEGEQWEEGKEPEGWPNLPTLNGWQACSSKEEKRLGATFPCKRDRLWGDLWVKGDIQVWTLNTSEYSHVGEYVISAVSNSKEALTEFLKDHGFDIDIEEVDTVEQWG